MERYMHGIIDAREILCGTTEANPLTWNPVVTDGNAIPYNTRDGLTDSDITGTCMNQGTIPLIVRHARKSPCMPWLKAWG